MKWISVEDELPDEELWGEYALPDLFFRMFYAGTKKIEWNALYRSGFYSGGEWYSHEEDGRLPKEYVVTHWLQPQLSDEAEHLSNHDPSCAKHMNNNIPAHEIKCTCGEGDD